MARGSGASACGAGGRGAHSRGAESDRERPGGNRSCGNWHSGCWTSVGDVVCVGPECGISITVYLSSGGGDVLCGDFLCGDVLCGDVLGGDVLCEERRGGDAPCEARSLGDTSAARPHFGSGSRGGDAPCGERSRGGSGGGDESWGDPPVAGRGTPVYLSSARRSLSNRVLYLCNAASSFRRLSQSEPEPEVWAAFAAADSANSNSAHEGGAVACLRASASSHRFRTTCVHEPVS